MAIREVLTSFTFEQQRQMINLIGADVGDASTLLTPTNVLVSGINEIVNGDVDLINQTHGMDDGTSGSPSLYWDAGQGFYKVDANKIALTTSLAIAGNLEVDGDITFRAGAGSGGTLTFGDLNTDNIVFNAELTSSIVPDSTANYNLGSATKQWNNLWIDGTASIDTLEVDDNSTFTGYLQVDSGDIRVPNTTTTVDLFDDYATTVEAFGAGTSIRIGDTSGTLTLRNPTLVGTETTQNVYNTVATTVNAFGAATNINMGVGGGGGNTNFNILSDDVVCSGDMNINGGELLSSSNTFDLLINNTDVRIGAANKQGYTRINNSLHVDGSDIKTTNSTGTFLYLLDGQQNALTVRKESTTTNWVQFRTDSGNERVVVWQDLYVVGNLDISGSTTVIDSTTLSIEDKNIELAVTSVPSDALADGGGITLKATTDKTITYNNTSGRWETNIGLNVAGSVTVSNGYLSVGSNTLVTPSTDADNLVIDTGDADSGISILSSTTGRIYFGDASNDDAGSIRYVHTDNSMRFETNDEERLRIGGTGLITFKGPLVEKGHYDSGGGLTGNYNHDLGTYGNVHYTSNNAAGAFTYNYRIDASTTLDSVMAVGETISTSLMHASNNTSYYMTQLKIDGTNVSPVWAGGSAPSAATGSGFDVYTFSIMKVGSGSFAVFATFANHA